MSIKPRELDHVVLRVADLPRAIRFYLDVIGCSEERRLEALGLVQLRAGSSLIDLVDADGEIGRKGGPPPGASGGNMDHLCIRVDPFDEAEIRQHLERHGVRAGATEMRYGAEGTGPSIYIQDPEGNTLELKGAPSK